jgi:hypothetical protein
MKETKLVKIFKSLTTEEWKYLRWFVQSNFFNTDPNLLSLYEAFAKHHPNFSSKSLTKEYLYYKVFVGQAYHDGKWRNLASKMNKLLEDYFVWLEMEHEPNTYQMLLTNAYGRRNLFEQFEKSTNELSDKLEKQSEQSLESLRERAQINLHFYHHRHTNKAQQLGRLQAALDDLDHYYFAEKLRLASELKVFENMVTGATPIRLVMEVRNLAVGGTLRQLPYLELYERLLGQLEKEAGLEQFQTTFDFFSGIADRLSTTDKLFGLLQLLNFAINQINKGEGGYRKMVMELYKLGLQEGMVITDGRISENSFVNIVSTGSIQKEYEWVKKFIHDYQEYLEPSIKEEIITLCLGLWHFHQFQFDQAIDLLSNFHFQSMENVLTSKTLLLRCNLLAFQKDSSYYTVFISYANAFDKFVNREKQLSLVRKGWYKNLIHLLLKIAKLKNEGKWEANSWIKIEVQVSEKPMLLKSWVLELIKSW